MTPRRALFAMILATTAVRLFWAANFGPGNDEAYHYLFTVHPDWSYFDHPPMVALIARLGLLATGGDFSLLGLRLGFVILFAGSTWILGRWTARLFGEPAGFFAAFALNVSAYQSVAAGSFAVPDGPLLFFWLLTLDRLSAAFETPERLSNWLMVGVAWGGAMLSKYHGIFLPMGATVFLLVVPEARRVLKKPGPYLAAAVGLVLFSPVLYWNATHGWASFAFQAGRAVGGLKLRPLGLLAAIGGQAAYLFPWIWALIWVCLIRTCKRWRAGLATTTERFLACQTVVPLLVFTLVACVRDVLPHWTLVAYLSMLPILGRLFAETWQAAVPRRRRLIRSLAAWPIVGMAVMLTEYETGWLQRGGVGTLGLVPPQIDPTAELFGWDQLNQELRSRGLLDDKRTFLFTSSWYQSGQVALATRESGVPVLCYNANDARGFRFWSRPEDFLGRDGILVAVGDRSVEPGMYDRFFQDIEPLGEFPIVRAQGQIRKIRLFRCVQQTQAFPYDGRPLPPRKTRPFAPIASKPKTKPS